MMLTVVTCYSLNKYFDEFICAYLLQIFLLHIRKNINSHAIDKADASFSLQRPRFDSRAYV